MFADTTTRVPRHTPDNLNERIREKTRLNLIRWGTTEENIEERMKALNREWDIERVLEANASSLVVIGTLLGVFLNPWLHLIPFLVGGFLLQHAVQGWCPPVRLFRRLGFRTHAEIASEYYALRLLRKDFDSGAGMRRDDPASRAGEALRLAWWD